MLSPPSRFWARLRCLAAMTASLFPFALPSVFANEIRRPTAPWQLPIGTVTDRGVRVRTARVVIFNRAALERDFAQLRGLSDSVIEDWILKHFAYINLVQLPLVGIRNSAWDLDWADQINLYIPPGVGRGAMIQVDDALVDLKASGNSSWNLEPVKFLAAMGGASPEGLKQARERSHASGFETYNLAGAEYLRQLEIQADYDKRNQATPHQHETAESYFLIDWGIGVIFPNEVVPAFGYGRQANFGRTANDQPLADEIYSDRGNFQATYFGTRIDFGGARTRREDAHPYHEMLKARRPDQVAEFIRGQLAEILASEPLAVGPVPSLPLESLESARRILSAPIASLRKAPVAEAIGRRAFEMEADWYTDEPALARIKWTLFQLNNESLLSYLKNLGDPALRRLFELSAHPFQMPLPEVAYRFGLGQSYTRSAAASAAAAVFPRFPALVPLVLASTFANLAVIEKNSVPEELPTLLTMKPEFPGYEDFLKRLLAGPNLGAQRAVMQILSRRPVNHARLGALMNGSKTSLTDSIASCQAALARRLRLGVQR